MKPQSGTPIILKGSNDDIIKDTESWLPKFYRRGLKICRDGHPCKLIPSVSSLSHEITVRNPQCPPKIQWWHHQRHRIFILKILLRAENTNTHTHTHKHACAHTRMHTRTHTCAHTLAHSFCWVLTQAITHLPIYSSSHSLSILVLFLCNHKVVCRCHFVFFRKKRPKAYSHSIHQLNFVF